MDLHNPENRTLWRVLMRGRPADTRHRKRIAAHLIHRSSLSRASPGLAGPLGDGLLYRLTTHCRPGRRALLP